MEIRVQFPRERVRPATPAGAMRPDAQRQVDPGDTAGDRHHGGGREQQPSANADIGGHVDKTA